MAFSCVRMLSCAALAAFRVSQDCQTIAPRVSMMSPCRDPFRPCYEFVPPRRVGLALLCILTGVYCAYEGTRVHGWLAASYALCIVALAGCAIIFIESGHQYDCGNQGDASEYRHSFQHNSVIVPTAVNAIRTLPKSGPKSFRRLILGSNGGGEPSLMDGASRRLNVRALPLVSSGTRPVKPHRSEKRR